MKFCASPFEYFYIDNYKGNVALCPWMHRDVLFVGNVFTQPLDAIWHGEKANRLRARIRQGDYSMCRLDGCPFLQNNNLPDKPADFVAAVQTAESPRIVNLAYDSMCNQFCETCRPKKFKPILPLYAQYMQKIHEALLPALNKASEITTSGHGDPFASPYMMRLLKDLRPQSSNLSLLFESNGVYCDERHWKQLAHLADCRIRLIITNNSYDKFVYEHISRGGNFAKLMNNLVFVKKLRDRGIVNYFALALVIQDRNFREIPSFIERSLTEFGADQVILKPCYQWGTMPDDVFWFKDVLNPLHPYHAEYLEILDHPLMRDSRVFNFGGRSLHPARLFPGVSARPTSVAPQTPV